MAQLQTVSNEAQTMPRALRRIVDTRPDALTDADKLRRLLADLFPDQHPEVAGLVSAAREGVPEAIGNAEDQ
jgi:hypothetical protein